MSRYSHSKVFVVDQKYIVVGSGLRGNVIRGLNQESEHICPDTVLIYRGPFTEGKRVTGFLVFDWLIEEIRVYIEEFAAQKHMMVFTEEGG